MMTNDLILYTMVLFCINIFFLSLLVISYDLNVRNKHQSVEEARGSSSVQIKPSLSIIRVVSK